MKCQLHPVETSRRWRSGLAGKFLDRFASFDLERLTRQILAPVTGNRRKRNEAEEETENKPQRVLIGFRSSPGGTMTI
jgi:hypothetical protein